MAPPRESGTQSIPHIRTSLVARSTDIEQATATLLDAAAPLLTLTGAGGVGKTRLAVAVANAVVDAFPQGVTFVDLSPIRDAGRVLPEMARTLGIRLNDDESAGATVAIALRSQQCLLVLDNMEQVIGAAPDLADLLAGCPALQILATSRVPLDIRVEYLQPVTPLTLPAYPGADVDVLAANDAVSLFVQRARAADPTFALTNDNAPTVAAICQRLDGLPLALELAAARIRSLSPKALLSLLSDRLAVLDKGPGDLPDRQRSLRATIAWSHDLLDQAAQRDFQLLGVFPAAFGTAAAASVLDAGEGQATVRLAAIADHNLLVRERGRAGEDRFRMLESVREFAAEQLSASGEATWAARRLALWCLAFAEHAAQETEGPSPAGWWERMGVEVATVQTSLDWALAGGEIALGLKLGTAMRWYWLMGGEFGEGQQRLAQLIDTAENLPLPVLVRACIAGSDLPSSMGEWDRARAYGDRAVALARSSGDPNLICEALTVLPNIAANGGRLGDAWRDGTEAGLLCQRAGNVREVGWNQHALALVAIRQGDLSRAREQFDLARNSFRASQDANGESWVMTGLGYALCDAGNLHEGSRLLADALRLHVAFSSITGIGICLGNFAWIATCAGKPDVAAQLCGAVNTLFVRTGLVLTAFDVTLRDPAMREARARLGEEGFAREWAVGSALSIREAADLALVVSTQVAANMPGDRSPGRPGSPALTRREQEVLDLLCQHWTAPEIAEKLYLSPRTVETHITHIYGKLGVSTRREALAAVARQAIALPPSP